MISGLASLIFGDAQQDNTDQNSSPLGTPELLEVHVDDDWILFSDRCPGELHRLPVSENNIRCISPLHALVVISNGSLVL